MADTLNIYGVTYQGVEGIKATDSNNNVLTYVRPQGTKTITENGTGIDVAQYQYADVNVSGGGSGSIVDVTDMPVFTVEFIDDLSDIDSISCNMTYLECYDYVTGQMVDEGYAAVALLIDVNNDVTSYYGCYYHGASAAALYFVVMDNTEPIGDLIFDNSGTITFSALSTALGIAGTPTATKGTVSNHSVAITPSVTNAAGYIAGGTKTGTAVTVSASELDSGTKSITANGTNQDVVGYAAVDVAVPNSYSAGDEGKVVSSGALVAQTAHADVTPTTSDQTIDTTTNNSIKVKGDADLVAANIKKDVEIFGVTGSYEGGGGGDPKSVMNAYLANELVSFNSDVSTVHTRAFQGSSVEILVFTNLSSTNQNQFGYASSLAKLDLSGSFSGISANNFNSSSSLNFLVIRNSSAVSLSNVSAFSNTPFASGKAGGTLYVPSSLISSYQGASNWSTILGYATNQIKSIESTHTDPNAPIDLTLYYADGTLIPT